MRAVQLLPLLLMQLGGFDHLWRVAVLVDLTHDELLDTILRVQELSFVQHAEGLMAGKLLEDEPGKVLHQLRLLVGSEALLSLGVGEAVDEGPDVAEHRVGLARLQLAQEQVEVGLDVGHGCAVLCCEVCCVLCVLLCGV